MQKKRRRMTLRIRPAGPMRSSFGRRTGRGRTTRTPWLWDARRLAWMIGGCVLLMGLFAYLRLPEPTETPPPWTNNVSIRVYNHRTDTIETMSLETYVLGVLAGEMPASYELEALKAQAVAARTYAYAKMIGSGCDRKDTDICTDSSHCQAYCDKQAREEKWGGNYQANEAKLTQAVSQTAGQVILYEGKPIDALFHSTSGGRTEDVENVYANALPYLRGVESGGEEGAPRFERTMTFSVKTFREKLEKINAKVKWNRTIGKSIGEAKRFASGRVDTIELGGQTFTGKQVRSAFGLDSTNFTIEVQDQTIAITTRGYGHGVGMSQVGADAMAKQGSDYQDILLHYYTGVEIAAIQIPSP